MEWTKSPKIWPLFFSSILDDITSISAVSMILEIVCSGIRDIYNFLFIIYDPRFLL